MSASRAAGNRLLRSLPKSLRPKFMSLLRKTIATSALSCRVALIAHSHHIPRSSNKTAPGREFHFRAAPMGRTMRAVSVDGAATSSFVCTFAWACSNLSRGATATSQRQAPATLPCTTLSAEVLPVPSSWRYLMLHCELLSCCIQT